MSSRMPCTFPSNTRSAELASTTFDKTNPDAPAHVAIRGEVFDLLKFAPRHYPAIVPTTQVLQYAGKDASPIFPVQVSALCYGEDGDGLDSSITLSFNGGNVSSGDPNAVYHDFRSFTSDSRPDWYFEQMTLLRENYRIGFMGFTPALVNSLATKSQRSIAILQGGIYDFTNYIAGEVTFAPGQPTPAVATPAFMDPLIVNLFQTNAGTDVSQKFASLPLTADQKFRMQVCMRNLFFVGKLDTRNSPQCVFARYILLVISCCLVSVIAIKFLAALQFGRKREPEKLDKFVIGFIPCYTEGEESMRTSIESWARMRYDDTRKLLFIVCDGMICGAGNELPTPKIVLDILGVDPEYDPEPMSYEALGEGNKQHNMAKVYSGLYEILGHIVPFVCVVKVGKPSEVVRTPFGLSNSGQTR
jgi:chitin synthase